MAAPARFEPQLATLVRQPPEGADWLHEIKLDGYRIGADIAGGKVTLRSRTNLDWTAKFPEIGRALARLGTRDAFLDGEMAVMQADGRTAFGALQRLLAGGPRDGLVYIAFDLLRLDGQDITALPIEERKERLRRLIANAPAKLPVRYADHVIGDGQAFFAAACQLGLEGIVSKRLGQPYRSGRGSSWLKTKGALRQEFVIGGFTERGQVGATRQSSGRSSSVPGGGEIGALLCGTYADDGRLVFAGKVGTGFSAASPAELRRDLDRLASGDCPFSPPPDSLSAKGARWVRPLLVCEISFSAWTDDGKIRHATFVGRRTDKPARAVKREQPGQGR